MTLLSSGPDAPQSLTQGVGGSALEGVQHHVLRVYEVQIVEEFLCGGRTRRAVLEIKCTDRRGHLVRDTEGCGRLCEHRQSQHSHERGGKGPRGTTKRHRLSRRIHVCHSQDEIRTARPRIVTRKRQNTYKIPKGGTGFDGSWLPVALCMIYGFNS